MPIYEYQCNQCGNVIERLGDSRSKREFSAKCGKCKKATKFARLVSVPRVNLKQGEPEVKKNPVNNSTTVEHWDGRKDSTVRPEPLKSGMRLG